MFFRRSCNVRPEIRQLDSERQSLVYNHHHELIAASDTIAAVSYCHFELRRLQIDKLSLDEDESGKPRQRPRPTQSCFF